MVAAVYFFVPSRSIRFVNRACSFCDCCQRPPAKSTSMRTTSCSPALITVNGIPFGNVIRTGGSIRKFFRVCISGCIVRSIRLDSILQKFFCPFQVLRGINSNSFHFTDTYLYFVSVLQPAKLLQRFDQFQRRLWKHGNLFQHLCTISIQSDVLVVGMSLQPVLFLGIPLIRNDRTAKIKCIPVLVDYHFR